MDTVQIYNQIARVIVKNYNTYLHPEDVKVLTTLDVAPHFTISHILGKQLAVKLHETAIKLSSVDSSLILNDPQNYHITLFWKGMDAKLNEKSDSIKQIVEKYVFDFEVEELLFGPLGISVKFYPKSESLIEARKELYNLTGTPLDIDERFVTTWVSLATYSQVPSEEVKKFVQENAGLSLGTYKVDKFVLYISTNKNLVNPQVVTEFECGKK